MVYAYIELDCIDEDDLLDEVKNRGYDIIDKGLNKELYKLLKSWECDSTEVFNKNMQVFCDKWKTKI